jgi:hypothetical protein
MPRHLFTAFLFALYALCGSLAASHAGAADGQILITQAKALAGKVTPGDAAGFPVTLSAAGSYKLAGNLTPGLNHNGIVAASPDITIDLNGFRISGGPAGGASNALIGIVDQGDRLTVKNGTIGAFETSGIEAPYRAYLIVENMRIIDGGIGINNTGGSFGRIQNSTVASNAGTGIFCGSSCQVEGSVVSNNGNFGVQLLSGTVLENTIFSNKFQAIYVPTSVVTVGAGNNTMINNNSGGQQTYGGIAALHPNVCVPVTC